NFSTIIDHLCCFWIIIVGSIGKNSTAKFNIDSKTIKFQTDLIMQRFVTFGPNGRKFPETNEQLNNYCDECNRLISKVEKYYEQCADGYNKNMAKISLYSLRHIMRTFCRSNNSSNGKKKQTNQQRKSAKKLKRLMALTPCLNRHRLNITCLDRFAERSWPLVDAPIDIFQNVINALCISENISDTDRCEKLEAKRPKFKNPNDINPDYKFKSFLMAATEILNSIDKS
ncbi:hypothetical protein DERP_014407, partial [Dermatophagoides pteronyssinus]